MDKHDKLQLVIERQFGSVFVNECSADRRNTPGRFRQPGVLRQLIRMAWTKNNCSSKLNAPE
jgi:hypothetical protein